MRFDDSVFGGRYGKMALKALSEELSELTSQFCSLFSLNQTQPAICGYLGICTEKASVIQAAFCGPAALAIDKI